MPHRQKIAVRAKMLMRCREALKLTSEGLSQIEVSQRMGVSTDSVKRYVQRALATESTFPSTLDSGQIGALRQIEAERLTKLWQKVQAALDQIQPRIGTEGERSLDGTAIARLVASGVAVSEQISRLFGLHAPVKIIEQQLRVSYQKTESKITISFDAGALEPPDEPVPGLEIFEGNGNIGQPRLLDTAAAAVATEFPG
jgi:transposase